MSEPKPSQPGHHHRRAAALKVATAIVSVSDTRTLETDTGGARIAELLAAAGHPVVSREVVRDEPERIREALGRWLRDDAARAVIFTGGTGVAPRDVTPETVEPLLERVVPGFGELFRMLSWQDVGSAALLSRALAGIAAGRVVFVLPGSRAAVELALEKLILPELGHLAAEAVKPADPQADTMLMRRLLLVTVFLASAAAAETWVWVDEQGVTRLSDDPAVVPEQVRRQGAPDRDALSDLWDDVRGPLGAPPVADGAGRSEERTLRLIRGAVSDLERGETARAQVALESVLRDEPAQVEAHWYLALLERQRGRYDSAQAHLEAFLAAAGDDLEPWRSSAQRRLEALADERRLAEPLAAAATTDFVGLSTPHFRVHYDAALGRASRDYARTVLSYLEEARETASERLGAVPQEAMGIVFYGKGAYQQAHRHRFSFQTVGFFDGRIHVVSAGHPAGELRALLFHEYTHAVFRERAGGDRPYWLNEGLAEIAERASHSSPRLTRSELVSLRARLDEGRWLPLRRLAPSFSGLDDADARAAYLEAMAAAYWIEARTQPAQRARLLARLGEGVRDDDALLEAVGLDTDGIDAALRKQVLREFPDQTAR